MRKFFISLTSIIMLSTSTLAQMIIPDSHTKFLTWADLDHLTATQASVAKQEIYARHGHQFLENDTFRSYFSRQSWYKPNPIHNTFGFFDPSYLNEMELKNLDLIGIYEHSGHTQPFPLSEDVEMNHYLLPLSSSILLDLDDIKHFSKQQAVLARREIYARHGHIFDFETYFNDKLWYLPSTHLADSDLSEIEQANVLLLYSFENQADPVSNPTLTLPNRDAFLYNPNVQNEQKLKDTHGTNFSENLVGFDLRDFKETNFKDINSLIEFFKDHNFELSEIIDGTMLLMDHFNNVLRIDFIKYMNHLKIASLKLAVPIFDETLENVHEKTQFAKQEGDYYIASTFEDGVIVDYYFSLENLLEPNPKVELLEIFIN
ncbi:MAG: hypothetical protein ATN31_11215 [Candidatus Epulonipiscioides saccharophilum]|nr:MAG: hypothetical protein ATN31_11215 [Epulopiscium sp. AS2M-Bin001]